MLLPMSTRTRGRILGGATVAIGASWLVPALLPQFSLFLDSGRSFALKASILPSLLIILVPGALLIGLGIQLFREATVPRVRWVLGVLMTLVALIAVSQMNRALESAFPSLEANRASNGACMFAVTVAAIAAYGPLVRWTLAFLKIPLSLPFHVVGRGMLFLLAVELWLFLSELYDPSRLPDSEWPLSVVAFGPILAAIAFYQVSLLLLARSRKRSAMCHP